MYSRGSSPSPSSTSPGRITIQGQAQPVRGERHRVEIDAVSFSGMDDLGQSGDIGHSLAASPDIPRFVYNQCACSELMTLSHDRPQSIEPSRHVPIEIELISIIGSDPRVGMPQDQIVKTAEIALSLLQKLFTLYCPAS